jgi:hypothetical protein
MAVITVRLCKHFKVNKKIKPRSMVPVTGLKGSGHPGIPRVNVQGFPGCFPHFDSGMLFSQFGDLKKQIAKESKSRTPSGAALTVLRTTRPAAAFPE